MAVRKYTGPTCYVGHDHESADGRPLMGGWHYTVVDGVPGEPLHLDEKTGEYRLAKDGDKSWHSRHHKNLEIIAPEGSVGVPRTEEEFEATFRHLDRLEKRIKADELEPHEKDHFITDVEGIHFVRGLLEKRLSK